MVISRQKKITASSSTDPKLWMGVYWTPDATKKRVYFEARGTFERVEKLFKDSIPEPYIKAILRGSAPSEKFLKDDGFEYMEINSAEKVEASRGIDFLTKPIRVKKDYFFENVPSVLAEDGEEGLEFFKDLGWVQGDKIIIPEGTVLKYVGNDGNWLLFMVVGDESYIINFNNTNGIFEHYLDEDFEVVKNSESIESSQKIEASASPIVYKGYFIAVDRGGDGYNVYDKSGNLEDEGFGSLSSAKSFVDKLLLKNVYSAEEVEVEEEEELEHPDQEFTSKDTSINSGKLPAIYNLVNFPEGALTLDYGGGKFDNGTEYLAEKGVVGLVYDPFNRTEEHNRDVLRQIRKNGGADITLCSNVLNVIKESEVRLSVLKNIRKLTKPNGTVYITVYEGKGTGEAKQSQEDAYQLHKKTADYLDEIHMVFPDAQRKGKLIIAHPTGDVTASQDVTEPSLRERIYEFLDELGGYADYNQKIEDVSEEFQMSPDEAEGYVCDWIQDPYRGRDSEWYDEADQEDVEASIKTRHPNYCPHCTNMTLVEVEDGYFVCDECGAEYEGVPSFEGGLELTPVEESCNISASEDVGEYKVRFYQQSGPEKGNLDREEFFKTKSDALQAYRKVFDRKLYNLNPTVWVKENDSWRRLMGDELVEASETIEAGKLVDTPQDVIDDLLDILSGYGFILDDRFEENPGRTWMGEVHIQVINPDSWIDENEDIHNQIRVYVSRNMIDEIHALEKRSNCPITWNFGVDDNFNVTGGLDIMKQYVDDSSDDFSDATSVQSSMEVSDEDLEEFYDLEDQIYEALKSVGGDLDDFQGDIQHSSYLNDRLILAFETATDRKISPRNFKKSVEKAIKEALQKTRFNSNIEIGFDERSRSIPKGADVPKDFQWYRVSVESWANDTIESSVESSETSGSSWRREYNSELEREEYSLHADLGEAFIYSFDDDGRWGYHATVDLNTGRHLGKSFYLKDSLDKAKKYCETCLKISESSVMSSSDINLPGYAVEWVGGYGGHGVNRIETRYFRTPEERDQFASELEDKGAYSIKCYEFENFYHTLPEVEAASYGGAYDIDEDQYFIKEELTEFGDKVTGKMCEYANTPFELEYVYLTDNLLEVAITDGDYTLEAKVKIDMRRIRNPIHLYKYEDEILNQLKHEYKQYYDTDAEFDVHASTFVPTSDIENLAHAAVDVQTKEDLEAVIGSLLSVDRKMYLKYSELERDSSYSPAAIGKMISDDLYYMLQEDIESSCEMKEVYSSVAPYKKEEFIKQLQDELYNKASEVLQRPEFGFELADVADYLVVEVYNYGEYILAEVRSELSYEGMDMLAQELNPTVEKYDKDAYFDHATYGIIQAYLQLDMIQDIQSSETIEAADNINYDDPIDEFKTYEVEFDAKIQVTDDDYIEFHEDEKFEDIEDDEFGIKVDDGDSISEHILAITELNIPEEPGDYRISGTAKLKYHLDNIYKEYFDADRSGESSYYGYYTDEAEATFDEKSSWVENFQVEKI